MSATSPDNSCLWERLEVWDSEDQTPEEIQRATLSRHFEKSYMLQQLYGTRPNAADKFYHDLSDYLTTRWVLDTTPMSASIPDRVLADAYLDAYHVDTLDQRFREWPCRIRLDPTLRQSLQQRSLTARIPEILASDTERPRLCPVAERMQGSLHEKLLRKETDRGPLLQAMTTVYQWMSQAECPKDMRHRWQGEDLKYFVQWLPHNGAQRWRSLFPKTAMDPITVGPMRAKFTTEYWQRNPLLATEERRALIQLIAAFDHPKAVDWLVSAQHEEPDKFLLGDISYALVGHNMAGQAVYDSLKQVFASQSSPEALAQRLETLIALAVLGSPDTLTLAKDIFLTPRVNPLALRLSQEAALLALYYQGGEAAWATIEALSHQQELHPQTVRWIGKLSYLHQGTRIYRFTDSISNVLHLLEDGPGGPLDLRWSDQGIVEMAQPLPRDPMTLAYFTHRLQRTDLPTSYRMTAARIVAPYRHYESIQKTFETLAAQEEDDELAEFAKSQAAPPPSDPTATELSCPIEASPKFRWLGQDEKIASDLANPDPQSRGILPQSHVKLATLDRATAGSVWEEVLKLPPPFTNHDLKLLITAPQPLDEMAWKSQSDAFYFTLYSIAQYEPQVFLGSEETETAGSGLFKSVSLVFVHNPETTSTQWEVDIFYD